MPCHLLRAGIDTFTMTASPPVVSAACSYELDEQLRLVAVDAAWSHFAVANGADELVPPGPLGRSIFSFMADATTVHLYGQLLERVTSTGTPVEVPLRCDSPVERRFLRLRMEPRQGRIHVSSTVLRTEARPAQALLEPTLERGDAFLRACSWCKRIEVAGSWLEVEEAVARLGLFERAPLPQLTHGMCEPCYETVHDLLDA